jgi:hypothetical protein
MQPTDDAEGIAKPTDVLATERRYTLSASGVKSERHAAAHLKTGAALSIGRGARRASRAGGMVLSP